MNELILHFQGFMVPVKVDIDIFKEDEFHWLVEQVFTLVAEDYGKIETLKKDMCVVQNSDGLSKETKNNFMIQLAAVYEGGLSGFVKSLFEYKVSITTSGSQLLLHKGNVLVSTLCLR